MPSRRGKTVPQGYLADASANEDENGALSCPHHGCDGMQFYTVGDCIEHEKDWHAGPYVCGGCEENFANRTALRRHEAATRHDVLTSEDDSLEDYAALVANTPKKRFVCAEQSCLMHDMGFLDAESLAFHKRAYPEHHGPTEQESGSDTEVAEDEHDEVDTGSTRRSTTRRRTIGDEQFDAQIAAVMTSLHDASAEAEPDTDSETDIDMKRAAKNTEARKGFICLEGCCRRYTVAFPTHTSFVQHTKTHGHVAAREVGRELFEASHSQDELEIKREAIRSWRCDVETCPSFGQEFAASKTYFSHIKRSCHRYPDIAADEEEVQEEETEVPVIQSKSKTCTVELCSKFGHSFSANREYKYHCGTASHQRAVEAMESQQDNEQTLVRARTTLWPAISSLPPSTGLSGNADDFYIPFSLPAGWREERLEEENRKLKARVKELEEEIGVMRERTSETSRTLHAVREVTRPR